MFRVPVLRQQLKRLNQAMEKADEDDVALAGSQLVCEVRAAGKT